MDKIQVSDNHRFLVTESGKPFFWLGDTAWELFHRLNRTEARTYFADRASKGFTVIQAVVLAEFDGLDTPNVYGDRPLLDNDPTRPNEAYFRYVDELIRMAAEFNLYIGLLPTWGDKVTHLWGKGPIVFNPSNARVYGQFLGKRYLDSPNVFYILGGDRPAYTDTHDYRPIWREMAAGIDDGAGFRVFKTYHPSGGYSTSAWLQEETWLDMHMLQSGHGGGHDVPVWEWVSKDYAGIPIRPVLDGEPNYEDHPVNPWPKWDPAFGYFDDYDVRKQIYRSVFAGACGVTYGHHSIWQFITPDKEPITHPKIMEWKSALDRPGAGQVGYLRRLMESRPFLSRIPDQEVLALTNGKGGEYMQATRDVHGKYLLIYLPTSHPVTVKMGYISSEKACCWWFDPREGCANLIGYFPTNAEATFTPPIHGPDWVLVVEDSNADFPLPGECSVE